MMGNTSAEPVVPNERIARVGSFEALDPSVYEQAMGPWQVLATPLSLGTFGYAMQYLVTPGITLYLERFAGRLRLQGLSPPGVLSFTVLAELGRNTSFWRSPLHEIGIPSMVTGGLDLELSAGQTQVTALIDLSLLRETWPDDMADCVESAATRTHVLPASSHALERFRKQLGDLLDSALAAPEMLQHPAAVRAVGQNLLAALAETLEPAPRVCDRGRPNLRQKGLAHAVEYLRSADLALATVPEICVEAGISQRALQHACHESFGLSPQRLLQLFRYHSSRVELLEADCRSTSVRDVAQANGFFQPGRFAAGYKAVFGESPSATLCRQCESIPRDILRSNGAVRPESERLCPSQ
jgi:AraC-like DNA-binding protein